MLTARALLNELRDCKAGYHAVTQRVQDLKFMALGLGRVQRVRSEAS